MAVNVSGGITVDGNGSLTAVGCANESTLNSAILLTSNFGDKISVSENGSITVPEGNAARVGIYYSGNNGDGMDAEISGGKVTAYGAKYGIYKVNLIMSGTGSVYTTGGSYAIGQTVPTIDEDEFVVKGSTESKASESAVTGEVKLNGGYYEIDGADAKTVVIKPDTSPRIILGKQTGIFKTEEYEIIEGMDMTDTKLKGTVYFDITLKNMSDEEFADARGYFGGDEPDLLASIIKTDYGWVCMVCDTEFSTTYDTDNTLTIKCGDIVSNTVQVKSNANRFNKVTQGDNTNRTVFYTNTSQEEKDNYKLVSTYTVDSESISYNWYSTNSAYSADELGAAVSGSNGEFKLADNIPAGNYVLYCDITYSDGDSTETVTEKFTFTYKECAHENGYSDGKCTNCGALCDHSNIDINTGKCNKCEHQFVATISTDGSAPTGYDTLADCLDSITADTENYVKIYQDIGDTSATATLDTIDVNHNVMIDLNGHKLNNIKLGVNKDVKLTLTGTEGSYVTQVYVRKGGSFVIDSTANVEFNTIFVEAGAQLAVNDGAKVTTEQLTVIASVADDGTTTTSVKLATGMKLGGLSYHSQNNSGVLKLGNLLDVTRQALRREDNGNYLDLYKEYGSMGYSVALTVVEHTDADHKYSSGTGKCEECGKPCEHGGDINTDTGICSICGAVVSVAIYTDANGISKYVDTDELDSLLNEYNGSGTIKLFKDYDNSRAQYDLYGELTIDVNGRRLNIRSITPCKNGKLTIKNSGNPVMLGCNVYPTNDASYAGGTLIIDGDVVLDTSIYVYDSSTVILKAGAYPAGLYARDSKTLYDMLGEGKAFFKTDGTLFNANVKEISSSETLTVKDHSHTYVDGECGCGYVCPHSDVNSETGKCNECEYQYAAVIVKDGAVASVYEENEMGAAFEAADSDANTGCTLKVYKNYAGSYTTLSRKFTLWIAEEANVGTLTVSGDITVTGSEKNNSIYGDFNVAAGGKLTFDENCGAKGTVSVGAGTFDCYRSLGIILNINDASSDVILHDGAFLKIRYNGGGDRANAEILTLLAENRMFMTSSAVPIDGSKTLLKDGFVTPVIVAPHEDHSYDSTTGKCTICGKRCGHTDVDSKTGVCSTCKYQLTAGISSAGTAKYFDNIDNAFSAALSAENSGCTLTLYKNCELSTSATISNATVTVDVNGYSLGGEADISVNDGGVLYLKDSRKSTYYGCIDAPFSVNGGTLINGTADGGSSAADVLNLVINSAKCVEIYGGIFENVYIAHASGVVLYGGRYNTICGEESNTPVNALLAKGYAFAILNSVTHLPESIVDGSAVTLSEGIRNVTVVKHTDADHKYSSGTGKCDCGYVCPHSDVDSKTGVCLTCEYQLTAGVSGVGTAKYFDNIDDAFTAALSEENSGCTLTLYKDCELSQNIVIGNATLTVDVNGHSISPEIRGIDVNDGGVLYLKNSGENGSIGLEMAVNKGGTLINGTADDSSSAVSLFAVTADAAECVEFYGGSCTYLTIKNGTSGIALYGGYYDIICGSLTDNTPVNDLLAKGYAFATLNSATHLPESIVDGSAVTLSKGIRNVTVVKHTHTYTETETKCACGAVLYAKVTSADGTTDEYFDSIEEGLLYADKAENKGCVFTLVTSGKINSGVRLSNGQFTITTSNYGTIYDYNQTITIDGADVIAEGYMFIRCKVNVKSGSLTLPEGSSAGFDSIAISGGTVTVSEGVNVDNDAGADNLFVSEDATDAKLTIGGGTYGNVYLGQFKLKDVIASGVRVISYDNPTDPTAEKTAKALLYSDIAEKNNFDSENNTVSYYLFTKCEHKNEDGSYAFNEGGICKYCNSEFAASVSYTADGGEKTELFGDIYDAFDKANGVGTATVTLYKDITDKCTQEITVMGNVTLELNGKTLGGRYGIARISVSDGGTLTVNGDGDMDTPIYVNENSKLVINGGGYFNSVSVKKGGNAEIGGGTIQGLSVRGNVKLSGGKFNDIEIFNGNLESVLADGYAYKVEDGTWLSIAERAESVYSSLNNNDKPLSVEEAPIKSASIAWVGEEAPVIYRNGEKYLYVDITYELAVGSRGATYSDFVNGNNRIKDYNLYNKYMVHCYEIGKLAAKDGEVEYYIVLKCNGYEYKSNVLKLTLATCSHPEDSLLYENDGFVICGICDALIEAEVVDADGKSLGYADIESAIKLAQENEGSTVKLMSEGVSESITVTGGRFTVDFNGKKVFYQFDVNGGDVTFTSSVKQADVETLISKIEVTGADAKVTIDGKIKLGSVTLTSGALAVNSTDGYIKELSIIGGNAVIDNAIIGALQTNGGDTVINCVESNSLSININGSGSISIVTGTFYSTTCKTGLGMAIASGSRVYDSNMNGAIIYTYDAIQTMTKTDRIFVDKCNHKDKNGSYVLDGNPCPYCNEEIVATVSYTANGGEETDLFSDIYDAFDKANEIGTATVTLYKDITDDITDTIAVTGNVTLELNGKRLSQPGTDVWYSIEVTSGKLTVNGSGLIKRVAVRNGSNAEINGGTFSDFIIKDGGNAVIKGGQFYSLQVSGEGRNVGQLLADGYAYWNFIDSGIWSTIAEREKQDIANVEVKEAPIKSATITAEDESPIIYRNGRKTASFTADVTYTGNETLYVTGCLIDGTVIKEKTDLSGNRYYLFSGEVDKAVAEDGEIQYYCIFTYDGYEYKSNAVTLTVATCQHPGASVKCDDNGNYVCGICNRALTASVELSDGMLSYYGKWNDAISAAQESEGCTLKLLNYSWLKDNETFDISKGRFTVDLNKNDSSGPFAFNVKGGDITFTASQAASSSLTGVTVSGENANVLIDSKATLNYLVVNSGKVSADGANIGAITINGGDTVINDVNADYLSMKADTTGGSGYNVSIVSGTFNIFTCENESNYTLGRAIASGSRVIGLNAIVGPGFKYAEIQSMTKANYLNVIKCDHKDENDSYALDGNLCPYCNEEIAATVSYTTANGGEQTDLFSDIYDAFERANERGTATITLYKDITNSELTQGVTITGNVTLALNGKKLGGTFAFNAPVEVSDGGMFTVGGDGKMRMPIKAYANSKLIINGGEFTSVMVYIDGDAEIGGGVIDALTIIGNAKAKISGGKFYNIEIANGSLESVLADGYAYKKDGGAWLSIAERAESVYSSVNNDNKPVNVEEAPIKSATLSTEINKLYRNSNANPTLKFNLALAHGSNLNDSYVSKRYGINSYVSGDIIYSSLSALVKDAKLSADEIIDKAGNSVAAKIYFVVITDDGYEIKSNTVSIDLVDCDHSQVVDPTADKETAGNITEPTYCEICESKFNAKITKGDDVKYYNDLDEAAKDAQKSENEGCTLYPLYNKNGYGGQLVITEGNFTLKYAVRTAFSRPIIINGKAKLTVTGRCAVTAFENQDAFIVRGGDVTFDGLATGSNVTINGGNVTMTANNINCLTINGGNVSISSGGFAEIVTTVSDKVIADYIDHGFWVQDRGTKEWIDIYSLNKATASSTNGLTVRLCPMQIIKPIDTVYYTNGYYPDGIPSLQINAEPWYSNEVDAKVAYQWIAIDENGYETVIEGATDRKLSLENLTTGRYYCRLTYSNATTAGVSMKSDVVTATITECEHSGGEATCTEKAKCEICGAEYGEPLGHEYIETVVAPTYTSKGYTVFECTRCKHKYNGNFVPVKPIPDVEEIAVEKTTYDEVDISWKNISGVDGYYVEGYVGDQWTKFSFSTDGDSATAKLSGLSAGLKYKVRIAAYAGRFTGKFRYFYVDTVPSPVWNINTVKATDETVRISWNRNTRADGYKVEWYIDNQWSVKTVTGNNNIAAVIDGLCAGTRYKVRVSAYKGDLYSPYTYGYIDTLPSKVTGITQTVTSSSFTLTWDKNESADGYTVQYYADGKWNEKTLVGNDKTAVTIGSLKGYKTYKVRIKAYKGELQSAFDDIYITTAPTKVSGLKVKSAVDSKAVVIWNADANADGYNVGYYIGGKWVEKTITDNKTAMAELDGLTPYSTYKVRVRAYKDNLYGDYSYTTVSAVLSQVTDIKVVSAKSNSITVKWGKNASADGYKVEIYKGGKWVKKTLKGSANATVTIDGLKAGSVYKVRIASYKGANTSTYTYANVNTAK